MKQVFRSIFLTLVKRQRQKDEITKRHLKTAKRVFSFFFYFFSTKTWERVYQFVLRKRLCSSLFLQPNYWFKLKTFLIIWHQTFYWKWVSRPQWHKWWEERKERESERERERERRESETKKVFRKRKKIFCSHK